MRRLPKPLQTVGRIVLGDSPGGRAAAMLSTVAAGASFMPGLLPRGRRDQVLATGLASALQHALVMNAQARHQALARVLVSWTGHAPDPNETRIVEGAVAVVTTVAGLGVYLALPPRHAEPFERGLARTAGLRLMRVGFASIVVATSDVIVERYGERSTAVRVVAPSAGFVVGGVIAAGLIRRFRRYDPVIAAREQAEIDPVTGEKLRPEGRHEETITSLPLSLALGFGVALTLNVVGGVEGVAAGWIAAGVRRVVPGSDPYAALVGHSVLLASFLAGLGAGFEYLYHHAEAGGSAIDAAYTTAPTSPTVSGGPESGIDWKTLSREGVRFVTMSLSPEEISTVTDVPVDRVTTPIRCFASIESAPTVGGRVGLVMEDLERLGAFERSVICLTSPTGTGYLNYVAVETLEYLTRGDCATVGLQYSLRPSFLSLDRVAVAREQNLALLNALVWRIRGLPKGKRPRLVGFGESLGAQTLQNCFLHEGVAGFHHVRMDSALFLGTPAASRWTQDWRDDPATADPDGEVAEVANVDEWREVLAGRPTRPRFVLLNNHEDPIVRFTAKMAVARPEWLPRGARPPGIPGTAIWMPYTSMLITLVDVVNALDFVPGVFVARGHDYRANIARMVSETYQLPVTDAEMGRIERALRSRERIWAEQRVVAEEMAKAGEAVSRRLRSWGELSSPPPVPVPPTASSTPSANPE